MGKTVEEDEASLATLNHGEAVTMFDEALKEAAANILDPNTDAKATRTVTLTLTLKPNEDRDFVATTIAVKSKLAAVKPHVTQLYLGQAKGKALLTELNREQPGLPGVTGGGGNVVAMKGGNDAG